MVVVFKNVKTNSEAHDVVGKASVSERPVIGMYSFLKEVSNIPDVPNTLKACIDSALKQQQLVRCH